MTDTAPRSRRPNGPPPLRLSEIATADPSVGLVCSKCGCRHFETVYTRPKPGCILRLRQCRHCGHRMVTRERAQ